MGSHLRMYGVGSYVTVSPSKNSEGGTGWVTANDENGIVVEYILARKISKQVDPARIALRNMDNHGRKRAASESTLMPSLLSPAYGAAKLFHNKSNQQPLSSKKKKGAILTDNLLSMPMLDAYNILDKKKEDIGWLRNAEGLCKPSNNPDSKPQYTPEEKTKALALWRKLQGNVDNPTEVIAKAWHTNSRTVRKWNKKGTDMSRKQRSDAGSNILTSTKKQEACISALNCFKKDRRRQLSSTDGVVDQRVTDDDLCGEFIELPDDKLDYYEQQATEQQHRIPFLISEIKDLLHKSRGGVTFSQMEASLTSNNIPIISKTTLRRIIMDLPGSHYVSTRLRPALSDAHKIKRMIWCYQFRIFWENAKLISKKKLILLVHMDEKIFEAIIVRNNTKIVPILGITEANQDVRVHHRRHVNKIHVLCSTYCLILGNDIDGNGGGYEGYHGALDRAGHMVMAEKTTYKRYTDPVTGRISYPKTDDNISRKAGQRYFEPCDITGMTRSKEISTKTNNNKKTKTTKTIRKYSLYHDWFLGLEIPKLERLTRNLIRKHNVDIIVRYQWDGAGPHANKDLVQATQKEFDEHGWEFVKQSPQSPLLNVQDCCNFASLARRVTAAQGLAGYGGHEIDIEKLWNFVHKTYYEMPLDVISRSFAYHTQMANAIAQCNGGDEYATSSGRHVGIRRCFTPMYNLNDNGEPYGDPIGIDLVDTPIEDEEENKKKSGLKYPKLMVESTPEMMAKYLSERELEHLLENLDESEQQWENVAIAIQLQQMDDSICILGKL